MGWLLLVSLLQTPESMLPADAEVYAVLENIPRDLEWARAILKAHCREGADAKLLEWFVGQADAGEIAPLLTIRSVHLAVRDAGSPLTAQAIAVAVSDAPDDLEMLVPEGTPEERREGATVYKLREMFVAFSGEYAIAATDLSLIDAALKRDGPGLQPFGKPHGEAPSFRGFVRVGEILRRATMSMPRRNRHEFDAVDAAFEFSGIREARIDAWIDGGRVKARVDVDVDERCAIWDLVHMAAGGGSSLGFVPNDAVYAATVALQDVPAWLERLEAVTNATVRHLRGDDEEAWAEVAEFVKRGLNIDLDEAARAFGPNLTHFAWIDKEKSRDFERNGEGVVFVMAIDKPDAVQSILDAAPDGEAFRAGLVVDEFEGVATYSVESRPSLAYAVMDDHLIVSLGLDPLKRTIAARKKGETMAAPKEARAKSAILNVRELCRVLAEQGFPPEFADALKPDAMEIGVIAERERGLTLDVEGPGIGVGAVAALLGTAVETVLSRRRYAEPAVPVEDPVFKPEEGFAVPEDAGERDALIDRCLTQLGAEQIETREAATTRLWQIGKPAVEKMVATYRSSDDPEVQARVEKVLTALREYKALPALLALRVREFVEQAQANGQVYAQWHDPSASYSGAIEPYVYRSGGDPAFASDAEVQRMLLTIGKDEQDVDRRRIIAGLLMLNDSSAVSKALLERIAVEADPPTRGLLRGAIGWGAADEAVRAEVIRGLSDEDRGVRRASFVAAERAAHPEVADALLARLGDDDAETRFNAAYTLGRLTGGALHLNGFTVDEKARADAAAWWAEHRDTIELRRPEGRIRGW